MTPSQFAARHTLAWRQQERQLHLWHFESLDNKAGLVLGFAGLLATLAPATAASGWFVLGGMAAVAVAAGFALSAFWPRRLVILEPARLRPLSRC